MGTFRINEALWKQPVDAKVRAFAVLLARKAKHQHYQHKYCQAAEKYKFPAAVMENDAALSQFFSSSAFILFIRQFGFCPHLICHGGLRQMMNLLHTP